MGHGFQSLLGAPKLLEAASMVKGSRLFDTRQSVGPLIEELGVRKAIVEQIPADRTQPDQVGTRPRLQEEVCRCAISCSRKSDDYELRPCSL